MARSASMGGTDSRASAPQGTAAQIINGRRGVTPDTALRLERMFGVEAQFWLNLRVRWDLFHAMHGPEAKGISEGQAAPGAGAALTRGS